MKRLDLEQPMMRLNFGGYGADFVLPWEQGVQVLNLMRENTAIISCYDNGKSAWKYRKDSIITATAFSPDELAQILMSGGE